ncbi:hypothetical protein [Streptomyces xantholiticus]|uniref:Uncharacterized protein n=1 Tax=Streptomyces xantholiticus TaxID=68285 RepID=A0ABV1UZM0_9ACTN
MLLALCRFAGRRLPRDLTPWGRFTVAAFFWNALPFALFAVAQQSVDSGMTAC